MHVNGKVIKSEIYFQNIKHLETELNLYDKIKCCRGAVSSYDYPDIRQSFGTQYVEYNGQWRHSKCLIVLQDDDRLKIKCLMPITPQFLIFHFLYFLVTVIYAFGVKDYYFQFVKKLLN